MIKLKKNRNLVMKKFIINNKKPVQVVSRKKSRILEKFDKIKTFFHQHWIKLILLITLYS